MGVSLLLQAAGAEVRELFWKSPIAAWVIILLIVPALVAFAAFVYRREWGSRSSSPGEPRRAALQWVLIGIRVAVILLVIGLLAQPVMRTTTYRDIDASVVLLVDDSLSADIKDKYADRDRLQRIANAFGSSPELIESTSRYDLAGRLLADKTIGFLQALRTRVKVGLYSFGASARKIEQLPRIDGSASTGGSDSTAGGTTLPPYEGVRASERVRESRIGDSLLEAVSNERGGSFASFSQNPVAGVVLLTDGQETPGGRTAEEAAKRLGDMRVPVYVIGVGNPDPPKDIRVVHIDVNDIVLAGDLVPFDAAIVSEGFEGDQVRVDLKVQGEVVATEYVTLQGKGARQNVRLQHRPPAPGDFIATVEVEQRGGELFTENNAASKAIKVLDQKIRVLFADGRPRWEFRHLRSALTRDPTMQTQVFLFSADPDFVQDSSPGVPSLTRFPSAREELFAYHVIVLGDVDAQRMLTEEQDALIKDFVIEAGGGVVFIAGENANPWSMARTDLGALLPVEVPDRSADISGISGPSDRTDPFNVELTPVGKEHTVMRLDNDLESNVRLWENRDGQELAHLPAFLSFQEVGREKRGAVVLARHPTRVDPLEGKGLVVMAFMNHGKGRAFFSAVDDTWRWRAGVDNKYFYRFWGQVIRFAATGRLLGKTPRYSISTDNTTYTVGESVHVQGRVFDASMKPSTERTLTVYHQPRSGDAGSGDGAEAAGAIHSVELQLDPVQGQGTYVGVLAASRLGLQDVWIGTESERLAFQTFNVVVPALELRDPRRNQALLESISKLSGGAFFELEDASRVLSSLDRASAARRGEESDDPLWDDGWVLLLFTGLLALEWVLRKFVNLL